MNINDAFPSKWLRAQDLGGRDPVVTIERVDSEDIGDELKAVVYFVGKEKGLVLNKTNAQKITALLNSGETDQWAGQKIRLYETETSFQGRTVPCIRVKAANGSMGPAMPSVTRQAMAPTSDVHSRPLTDDDIPF